MEVWVGVMERWREGDSEGKVSGKEICVEGRLEGVKE